MRHRKDTSVEGDNLHWSFGSTKTMIEKVFPEGFSAEQSTLPDETFLPEGNFRNSYDLVYTGNQDFTVDNKVYYGYLILDVSRKDGAVEILVESVRQLNQNFNTERQQTTTLLKCRDEILYPLSEGFEWKIVKTLHNIKDDKAAPFQHFEESGRYTGKEIEKMDASGQWYTYKEVDPLLPLLTDWSVLAGCHTLAADADHDFAYLQQLDRYSYRHNIKYMENFMARFGVYEVSMKGYIQRGYGITPSYYWTDEQGRLLIANYSLYALVYNPAPKLKTIIENMNL